MESQLFSHRTFRKAPMYPPLFVKVAQPERPRDRKEIVTVGGKTRELYKLDVTWRGISTNNDEEPLEGYYIKVKARNYVVVNRNIFNVDF